MTDHEMSSETPAILVRSPMYLLLSKAQCHACDSTQPVVAIGATEFEEDGVSFGGGDLSLLSQVESLPREVLAYIQRVAPGYRPTASKTAGLTYFANTCSCGAFFGDFYLFSEPGGAFFPETVQEASLVEVSQIPLSGPFEVVCSLAEGTPIDMMFENGIKLA